MGYTLIRVRPLGDCYLRDRQKLLLKPRPIFRRQRVCYYAKKRLPDGKRFVK